MSFKTLMINKNVHAMLDEISKKRKANNEDNNSMAAIIAEMTIKQHKKEIK